MSHSNIGQDAYAVQTSDIGLGTNTTKVGDKKIPTSAMTQFLTGLFQFCTCSDHFMSINYSYVSFQH